MTGSQESQNSGQPCSSSNGRPAPVRATWKLAPFASIVRCSMGVDFLGCVKHLALRHVEGVHGPDPLPWQGSGQRCHRPMHISYPTDHLCDAPAQIGGPQPPISKMLSFEIDLI